MFCQLAIVFSDNANEAVTWGVLPCKFYYRADHIFRSGLLCLNLSAELNECRIFKGFTAAQEETTIGK